jgi:hypothetical protein
MKPSPNSAFEHTTVPYGDDGKMVNGIIARCGNPSCGAAVPLAVNTMSGFSPTDPEIEWRFIAKKLEAKGWRIGRSRGSHRCPKCFAAAKYAAIRKSDANAEAMAQNNKEIAMQVVENTRLMSREDRRLIFEKLREVYVDDKVGYGAGWTDEKVATDLGVPRAWVRVIRDENFGEEISNEDIRAKVKEAHSVLAQIKAALPEIQRLIALADKVEKNLADISRVFK